MNESVPELRLSDVERDHVIAQLSLAMSEGRLDVSEFEERSRQVYGARIRSDLDGVMEGLPVVASQPTFAKASAGSPTASAGHRWFFSLLGDRTQRGDIDLGDKATSISVLGDTTFDLTQVAADHVNLRIYSLLGDVTILVRSGTRVAAKIVLLMGDRIEDAPTAAGTDALTARVQVVALMGDVKIRVID